MPRLELAPGLRVRPRVSCARPVWWQFSERLLSILDQAAPCNAATSRRRFLQLLELEDEAHAAGVASALIEEIEYARCAAGLAILEAWRPQHAH
jgi:hypothetical protein